MFSAYVEFVWDHFFLLSTDSTYSRVPGDKGGPIFSDLRIISGACFTYKLVYYNLYHVSNFRWNVQFLHKIECIKFVCIKFVLILEQINLIQFENTFEMSAEAALPVTLLLDKAPTVELSLSTSVAGRSLAMSPSFKFLGTSAAVSLLAMCFLGEGLVVLFLITSFVSVAVVFFIWFFCPYCHCR